ncbi:glycosyl hydrolase family 28 protein [Sodalis endosymbiont of Spalangia cameroni]|uniref:glycoside hydrolase family 28 protein n=1 Tax=Sodalis praecaptivus TaxID=1239307 RepID=UPI0031F8B540
MTRYNATHFPTLQDAIDAVAASASPGASAELIVPAGVYETGPVTLYSDLILTLEAGAIIRFRADPHCYPPIWTRWEGIECYAMRPLMYASEASNITLRGEGVIDGAGQWWWDTFRQIEAEDRMTPRESYELALAARNPDYLSRPGGGARPQTQFLRPPLLQFWKCCHIRLEDITLQNSPFWTCHTVYSRDILLQGVKILNPADAINTDAVDLDSSEDIVIEHCLFDVGDDAVTLKSGSGADGLRINLPTRGVTVSHCKILASHGGIAIGSETAGGIEDVTVNDCVFEGTQRAIRLKSRRGRGGTIKNITLSNLTMTGCWCPIVIGQYFAPGVLPAERDTTLSETAQPVTPMTPRIENVRIAHVQATDIRATAAFIVGLPEAPIQRVTIENYRYSLAQADQLLPTWHTEPTEGHFHDDDRGIKVVNAEHVTFL